MAYETACSNAAGGFSPLQRAIALETDLTSDRFGRLPSYFTPFDFLKGKNHEMDNYYPQYLTRHFSPRLGIWQRWSSTLE